jgi:HPr kinase/phosphorylase
MRSCHLYPANQKVPPDQLDQSYFEILGVSVPHVTIPVRTGRDLARLVEVAALDQGGSVPALLDLILSAA